MALEAVLLVVSSGVKRLRLAGCSDHDKTSKQKFECNHKRNFHLMTLTAGVRVPTLVGLSPHKNAQLKLVLLRLVSQLDCKPFGAMGSDRRRMPVALKIALPTAGARPTIGVSPAPAEGTSLRSTNTTSIAGTSLKRGT